MEANVKRLACSGQRLACPSVGQGFSIRSARLGEAWALTTIRHLFYPLYAILFMLPWRRTNRRHFHDLIIRRQNEKRIGDGILFNFLHFALARYISAGNVHL